MKQFIVGMELDMRQQQYMHASCGKVATKVAYESPWSRPPSFICRLLSCAGNTLRTVFITVMLSLGLTHSAFAAIAYVQSNAGLGGTTASMTIPFTSTQAAGDLNIVFIAWLGSPDQVLSVTDSAGNIYAVAAAPTNYGGAASEAFYAKNITATNTNTVTVTFDGEVGAPDIRIAEYSGLDTTNPLDGASGNIGSGTAADSGSVTTTYAHDLLVGGNCVAQSTAAPGSGYTSRMITSYGEILEDTVVTTTSSYSAGATNTVSDWWIMQVVAFKAADGGSTPPTPITYTYSYDANGRISQVSGSDGSIVIYIYDANGNVTTINRQ